VKNKTIEIVVIILLIGIAIGLIFTYKNQVKNTPEIQEFSFLCDFENQNISDYFYTTKYNMYFAPGKTSNTIFYDGSTALNIPSDKTFQDLILLRDIAPSKMVVISFKRQVGSDINIVAQGTSDKDFYHCTNLASNIDNNGWEEVILRFKTEKNFNDKIKIYFWNRGNCNSYIDDLKITIKEKDSYPQFENEEPLLIYIEEKELAKINNKREEALEKGILQTEDNSWVNAIIYGEGKMMRAKIRLKGDWLDHLVGLKWSFRIKLKEDSWKSMRVFSVQNPYVRGYNNAWITHKTCEEEDILTTRYGYTPVYLNGKSLGLYAFEEHFQKELVESSKRREGAIVKFNENDFWDFVLNNAANDIAYETSVIEPFSSEKTIEDSVKYRQFILAQNLLNMYRNLEAEASDIFDVRKHAKFLAFINSRNAFHALQWHNQRFYYNPVLCRLEQIAFDMFGGPYEFSPFPNPISPMLLINENNRTRNCLFYLSNDTVFSNEYVKYLKIYSSEKNYIHFINKYQKEYNTVDSLQKIEFDPMFYNTIQFDSVLYRIEKWLPVYLDSLMQESYIVRIQNLPNVPIKIGTNFPETLSDKYVKCFKDSDNSLLIKSFLQHNITIIGVGNDNNIEESLSIPINNNNSGKIKEQNISIVTSNINQLFFQLPDNDTVFTVDIIPWPAPTTYNPRNDIAENATDISQFTNNEKREIHFSGNITFDNHVYTPIGYNVIFEAGTNIDIINNSAFIVNSTVQINGTKDNPVKIFSSDKTANGFTVLQAPEKSKLNYAVFDNLNTLDYNWWTLTGAVTFYESDVEFNNCTFTNNHCEDMLNTVRCDFYLNNCFIENTFGDSHDSDFCTGILDNCTFINNGNDAIDFSTSEATIIDCTINGAGDKGISVGENTKAKIINVDISDVNIGIASKDLSHAEVDGCKINNATYGFLLLQKKPEFGPATISANNCETNNVWTESLIEINSILILNGKTYKGKKGKLKALFYE